MDNTITLIGNLTREPELKYSNNGNAYARAGIAVNRRKKQGDDWVDDVSFFDISILGSLAENAATSLSKGDRVILTGRLEQRTVEQEDGTNRSYVGVVVDEIGPALRWATASIIKNPKTSKEGASSGGGDFFDDSEF